MGHNLSATAYSMMGPGQPGQRGGHVGRNVTVGVLMGQHLVGQPIGTMALSRSGQAISGQTTSASRIGHPMNPGLVVTVGQAGAMMVVRLVVVLVVRGQMVASSGETVISTETAPSTRLRNHLVWIWEGDT